MGDFYAEHKGSFIALFGVIAALLATKLGLEQQVIVDLLAAIAAIVSAYIVSHNVQKGMAAKGEALTAIAEASGTNPPRP